VKIPTALTAIFLAAINFAGAQTTETNAAPSTPPAPVILTPPAARF